MRSVICFVTRWENLVEKDCLEDCENLSIIWTCVASMHPTFVLMLSSHKVYFQFWIRRLVYLDETITRGTPMFEAKTHGQIGQALSSLGHIGDRSIVHLPLSQILSWWHKLCKKSGVVIKMIFGFCAFSCSSGTFSIWQSMTNSSPSFAAPWYWPSAWLLGWLQPFHGSWLKRPPIWAIECSYSLLSSWLWL